VRQHPPSRSRAADRCSPLPRQSASIDVWPITRRAPSTASGSNGHPVRTLQDPLRARGHAIAVQNRWNHSPPAALTFSLGNVVGDFINNRYSALRRLWFAAAELAVMSALVMTVSTIAKYGL